MLKQYVAPSSTGDEHGSVASLSQSAAPERRQARVVETEGFGH